MSVADELTSGNIDSYARACIDIASELWSLSNSGKFGYLLMPSRGAFPILRAAHTAFQLGIEHGAKFGDLPESTFDLGRMDEIWLPFTAVPVDNKTSSAEQRMHWCKVLKGLLFGNQSPQLAVHRFITESVFSQRFDLTEIRRERPTGLVIVDTVISGRAAVEISQALDALGLRDFFMILAVDENGKRIRKEYKKPLSILELEGRAKFFNFSRIFTEDRHPGLSGITAVVFPELMSAFGKHFNECFGVGFWHIEVAKRHDNSNLPFTLSIAKVNQAIFNRILELSKFISTGGFSERLRKELADLERSSNCASRDFTKNFIRPAIDKADLRGRVSDITISGTYIVNVHLDGSSVDEILSKCHHAGLL